MAKRYKTHIWKLITSIIFLNILGKTKIKYNVKRSADPEPYGYYGYGYPYYHYHGYKPYKPASIANINYGKTGIKYLRKRSADPIIRREAEAEAGPMPGSVRPKPLFWFRSDTQTETHIVRYFRPIL